MFGFRRRKTLTRQDVVWCFANIMGRLEPMRAPEHRKIRVGKECDGGYVMLDDFTGIVAAYSIGISDEVSRDLDIAQRGIEVFQYDHTIPSAPLRHARLHWTRKGLGADVTADLETLPRLLEMNCHVGCGDMILKVDVEGCEWEVLASLPPGCLRHFRQVVLEAHFLERLVDPAFAMLVDRAVEVLTVGARIDAGPCPRRPPGEDRRGVSLAGRHPVLSRTRRLRPRGIPFLTSVAASGRPTTVPARCCGGRSPGRPGPPSWASPPGEATTRSVRCDARGQTESCFLVPLLAERRGGIEWAILDSNQ